MTARQWDAIIIGAGAAGLMCALTAGQRGRAVLLIDHAARPGEKIRISGGGRCNFTNIHSAPGNFLSENPKFCISALKRYGPGDFLALVARHKIAWHEKTLGQLFCDDSSQQIIDMLLAECGRGGVTLSLSTQVSAVEKTPDGFRLATSNGPLESRALVVASGGKSIPKMGATGFGYELAAQFGLAVTETRPALVPFTLSPEQLAGHAGLPGVAAEVVATAGQGRFREAMLFTHRGLSGPAILQVSSYWREGAAVTLDFLPDDDALDMLKAARSDTPKQQAHNVLARHVPKKLADFLAAEMADRRLADLSDKALRQLADRINRWSIRPGGTEGYRTAEVTLGGVATGDLSSTDMRAKAVPGLYLIGEVVDVTGHLGGHNFQWAWASGVAAGSAL